MGKLYDARLAVEKLIEQKGLDAFKVKGDISLKSGLLLNFIKPDTPDDNEKLEKLKNAVKVILNEAI